MCGSEDWLNTCPKSVLLKSWGDDGHGECFPYWNLEMYLAEKLPNSLNEPLKLIGGPIRPLGLGNLIPVGPR